MIQRITLGVTVVCVTFALACASDESAPAESDEKDAAPAKQEADTVREQGKEVKHEEVEGDDPATALVGEEALAAIPERMRPDTVLPELQLLVPDLDNGGLAMFSDVVTIEGGEDVTYCTYLSGTTDDVTYIHNTRGSQSKYGHHAILQYSTTPQEPGTRPCSLESEEGQQGQIIGGTGGEGTGSIELPSNVVSAVPKGAQFIINHHWINYGEESLDVQAEMITIPPMRGEELMIARAFTVVVADFQVPPFEVADHSGECEIPEDMNMISMIGHEHRYGTHVKGERMGEDAVTIFDHSYNEDMISHPLTKMYAVDEPLQFKKGDRVRMSCQWDNTTAEPLTWPTEMCVMFGWRLGGERDSTCLNGKWR